MNTRDVIGVFDLDKATDAGQKAKITDEFLRHAQKDGAVVDVSGNMPRSFVLTDFPAETVYITQISTAALRARAETDGRLDSFFEQKEPDRHSAQAGRARETVPPNPTLAV